MSLNNIKVILIEPQIPGNIGAVARAMKTMGLYNLTLVKPAYFPHKDAFIRATHAVDVLENCLIVDNLLEAITHCNLVIGTSIRDRGNIVPALSTKQTAIKIIAEINTSQIALIFGTESSGMTGEDIRLCNYYGYIPSNPDFSSLNLASAVQIFCYEIYQLYLLKTKPHINKVKQDLKKTNTKEQDCGLLDESKIIAKEYPSNKQLEYFYHQFEKLLYQSGFIRDKHPGIIMQRLRGLFNRARIENKELNIFLGIVNSVKQKLK